MKKTLIFVFILSISTGCYKKLHKKTVSQFLSMDLGKKIRVDSTFTLYIRKTFKETDSSGFQRMASEKKSTNILIDVSYLMVSERYNKVIYLSTVPDKYKNYYQFNYINDNVINFYDLNVIQFGQWKPTAQQITFKSGDKKLDVWNTSMSPSGIKIHNIQEIKFNTFHNILLLDSAFAKEVFFERIGALNFVYKERDKHEPSLIFKSINNELQFINSKKRTIYMGFKEKDGETVFLGKNKCINFDYEDFLDK